MSLNRARVTDWALVRRTRLVLGKAFAFVGDCPGGRVASLLGPGPTDLPGVTVNPLSLPALRLAGVVSDKALYGAGRDTVHLLAFRLALPNSDGVLEVAAGPASPTRLPVRLDRRGLAPVVLRDLSPGDYEVRWADDPGEPACAFTVAEYRLAPLVASLLERRLTGQRLQLTLRLETFGIPVEGPARLELTDRGRRIAEARAVVVAGLVEFSFELTGDGPHAINVQLEADAPYTATVPLVGSRAAERTPTVFSRLGAEVTATLLPGEGTREVRGLHLRESAARKTPFRLERVDAAVARLSATTTLGPVCLVALDPLYYRHVEVARAAMTEGEVIELPLPGPLGIVAIGCWLDGALWEGWAAALRPDPPAPRIVLPERTAPGEEVTLTVETGQSGEDVGVYLVVKDAHLLGTDTPASRLAGQLKVAVEATLKVAVEATSARLPAIGGGPAARDFLDVLLRNGDLGVEQVEQVRSLAAQSGARMQDVLDKLGYANPEQIMSSIAEFHGLQFVDLSETTIPASVVERVPESVARENLVLPLAEADDALVMAMSDPSDSETLQKLQFILNRDVIPVLAPREQIVEAINRHYGQPETQSVDSMLAEFTDTAIDFTDTGFRAERGRPPRRQAETSIDLEACIGESAEETGADRRPEEKEAPARTRGAEPEVLFAGLLPAPNGRAAVTLRLGEAFADYVAEGFVVSGLDWASAEARFRAEKLPFVALDLPAFVHPNDTAIGRVHAGAASGRLRVRVWRDDAEVPLLTADGRELPAGAEWSGTPAELSFLVGAGDYRATVEDAATGAVDHTTKRVEPPGKLRTEVRSLRFLLPGEAVTCSAPDVLGLRVLPGLEQPFAGLVEATADYEHCCCEQTAAKVRAGCAMYALGGGDGARRARAEAVIRAGVRREASMWLPGRGFKIYPHCPDNPDDYCGPLAARHLWDLELLRHGGNVALGPGLQEEVRQGLEMARDATAAYGLSWPPHKASSAADLYAVMRFSEDERAQAEALRGARELAGRALDGRGKGAKVLWRAGLAYVAACLLRGGTDLARALELANEVVAALNDQGRLYSTVDSSAALALMAELRSTGVLGGGVAEVDGQRVRTANVAGVGCEARSVRVLEGVVAVEVARAVVEDWESFTANVPVRVALEKVGQATNHFTVGDALDLRVALEAGYRAGDLLWVFLPDALSRVLGGGQVKRFAIDFAGRDEVCVPLAATAPTPSAQHFAVCVRNMFEEERAGNPGLLSVTVSGPRRR
jgi:hypothetical protein